MALGKDPSSTLMMKITDIRSLVRGKVPIKTWESSFPWKGPSYKKRDLEINRREVLISLDIGIKPDSHKRQGNQHVKVGSSDIQRENLHYNLSHITKEDPLQNSKLHT